MSPLINDQEWKSLFSKAEYRDSLTNKATSEVSRKVKAHSLKYLAALNQDHTSLISQIEQRDKNDPQFKSAFTKYRLTLLHIAVLLGSLEVLECLLKKDVDVNARDSFDWTPLHHAALVSDQIAQALLLRGADQSIENRLGGTYVDHCKLNGTQPSSSPHTLFFKDDEGNQKEVTGSELAQLTGLDVYMEDCLVKRDIWPKVWKRVPNNQNPIDTVMNRIHKEQRQSMEYLPLLVRRSKAILNAKNFGVFTLVDLPANFLIGEYIGEIKERAKPAFADFLQELEKEPTPTEGYIMDCESFDIDPATRGNVLRFVNDGWPNCRILTYSNNHGLPSRKYLVTLEEIAAGQELVYSYGLDRSKWGQYTLIRRQEIFTFLDNNSAQHLIHKVNDLFKRVSSNHFLDDTQLLHDLMEKIIFIFATPALMIDAVLSNKISTEDLLQMWKLSFVQDIQFQEFGFNTLLLYELIEFQRILRELTNQGQHELSEQMCQTVLELLPQGRMIDIAGLITALKNRYNRDSKNFLKDGAKTLEQFKYVCLNQWNLVKNLFILLSETTYSQGKVQQSASTSSKE